MLVIVAAIPCGLTGRYGSHHVERHSSASQSGQARRLLREAWGGQKQTQAVLVER